MFKILLKKQLFEIFRSWFYNPKTNKMRSKGGAFAMGLMFFLLVFGMMGGVSVILALGTCPAMLSAGVPWLYFDLFALMATAFGLFGSVLNTYSQLYLSKDNDLLLSMPIPVKTVVASRVCITYIMGSMYSAIMFLPAVVVYQTVGGFDAAALLGGIAMMAEITLLVCALSCLLGFAVAKISIKTKNRSFVAVFASVVFIVLYYYVFYKAEDIIKNLTVNAAVYGAKIEDSAHVLCTWGKNGTGSLSAILVCLTACAVFAVLTWCVLNKTFLGIATTAPAEKKLSAEKTKNKAKSLSAALLAKEFSRFTSSANYMLNCGLGVLLIPAAGIALLIKGDAVLGALSDFAEYFPVVIVGLACMMASMNDMATPSVSLEGKSLWVLQSLPVEPWQIIKAKMRVQLILTAIPMVFFCICVAIAVPMPTSDMALCFVCVMLFVLLSALFNVFIGLKMPVMEWSTEIVPIKQSAGVAIALFGGWAYAAVLAAGFFAVNLSSVQYLAIFAVLTAAICAFLYHRLKTEGAQIFKSL